MVLNHVHQPTSVVLSFIMHVELQHLLCAPVAMFVVAHTNAHQSFVLFYVGFFHCVAGSTPCPLLGRLHSILLVGQAQFLALLFCTTLTTHHSNSLALSRGLDS